MICRFSWMSVELRCSDIAVCERSSAIVSLIGALLSSFSSMGSSLSSCPSGGWTNMSTDCTLSRARSRSSGMMLRRLMVLGIEVEVKGSETTSETRDGSTLSVDDAVEDDFRVQHVETGERRPLRGGEDVELVADLQNLDDRVDAHARVELLPSQTTQRRTVTAKRSCPVHL